MKVRWTPEAEADRLAIWNYLTQRNPAAALDLDQRFGEAAAALADFPLSGHAGEVPGTRELTRTAGIASSMKSSTTRSGFSS